MDEVGRILVEGHQAAIQMNIKWKNGGRRIRTVSLERVPMPCRDVGQNPPGHNPPGHNSPWM